MAVMAKDGEYVDDAFIILATKVFSKTIKIIPVIGARTSVIENLDEPPTIFLLYFQEFAFARLNGASVTRTRTRYRNL